VIDRIIERRWSSGENPRKLATLTDAMRHALRSPQGETEPYRIAGIDVHKKMLAVVVADVEVDGDFHFETRPGKQHRRHLRRSAYGGPRTSRGASFVAMM